MQRPTQRFVQALCDSTPVLALVVLLVVAHAALLIADDVSLQFELFTAAFFAVEIALRVFAAGGLYRFLMGWGGGSTSCS